MQRLICAAVFAALTGIASATAQTYPARPITMIVPYPPGRADRHAWGGFSPNACAARSASR